jgi:hypothetical protein
MDVMYPDDATLMELGRIAVAAGRVDVALGAIWWHLAPDQVDEAIARKAPAGTVRSKVTALASERLDERHAEALQAFVEEAAKAQSERNDVLHSRWILRGPNSMRPVSEFLSLDESDRLAYLSHWEREARDSDDWELQRSRSMDLGRPFELEQLIRIERRLANAEHVAVQWHFRLASMRETGVPLGWRGPGEARRGPQPLPSGALTGTDAVKAMHHFIERSGKPPRS